MTNTDARDALAESLADIELIVSNFVVRGTSLDDGVAYGFDLQAEVAQEITNDIEKAAKGLLRKQLVPYDPSYQTNASQVLIEELEAIPELAAFDATLRGSSLTDDQAGSEPVVAMAHVLGVASSGVIAYRMTGPGIAVGRRKGVILIPRDGVYERVPDVLYYQPTFDVFTCAGFAYFIKTSLIQSRLHAPDKARALAKDTLKAVTENLRIEGYGELERAVMDDSTLRAKMAHVARLVATDASYVEALTTERLVDFVVQNPQYGIPLGMAEGSEALVFVASPQHRHQIPSLLADDFLFSRLTNRSYEAGSKQQAVSAS